MDDKESRRIQELEQQHWHDLGEISRLRRMIEADKDEHKEEYTTWVVLDSHSGYMYCQKCGHKMTTYGLKTFNYCPMCGIPVLH